MVFAVLMTLSLHALSSPKAIIYEGKEIYLNGMNVAWNSFGTDFGMHHEWGGLYDPVWFEKTFRTLEKNGVNCIRIWIHCDGRSSPEFDDSGYVTGIDFNFFIDFEDMLMKAASHNILVMPVLWSFDMAVRNEGGGKFAGVHADLLTDEKKQQSYIDNFMIPFCKFCKDKKNVIAIETTNEPEWMIDIVETEAKRVPIPRVQCERFNGRMAACIHRYAKKMATVGVSACFVSPIFPKKKPEAAFNLFSNDSMKVACPDDSLAYFDFYQIHWYPWMNDEYWQVDLTKETVETMRLTDKPVIIGEIQNRIPVSDALAFFKNGMTGILMWSISEKDTAKLGHWERDGLPVMKAVHKAYKKKVKWKSGIKPSDLKKPEKVKLGTFETKGSTDGWLADKGMGNGKVITSVEWSDERKKRGKSSLKIHVNGLSAKEVDKKWPFVAALQAGAIPPPARDLSEYRYISFYLNVPKPPQTGSVQAKIFAKVGKDWTWCAQEDFVDLGAGWKRLVLDIADIEGDITNIRTIGLQFQTYSCEYTGDIYVDEITVLKE